MSVKNKKHTVYIGVGSNIGDRLAFIRSAGDALKINKNITLLRTSNIYETQPYGYKDQELFLNGVFELETEISPDKLLSLLLDIEKSLNRTRPIHWGPRTIDLDILFYDDFIIQTDSLTIPHKELHKRLFVLVPLNDLAPEFVHPLLKKSCWELEENCRDQESLTVEFYIKGM